MTSRRPRWILALGPALLLLAACAGERPPRADGPGPAGRWRWERVPVIETVERPVCERRAEPTKVIKFVPQYEEVEEEILLNRRVPLRQEVCDPCTGQVRMATYGHTWTRVPAGTRKVRKFTGYEPEAHDSGFSTWEHEQTGTRTEQVVRRWRWEQVPCEEPGAGAPAGTPQASSTEGSGG